MGKKVLVVDDEPDIRNMLTVRLQANGFTVAAAANGREGLTMMEDFKPDLVILDVLMPEMDGFEVFKIMKKDPKKVDIPVLMLTARGGMRDTFEMLDADGFIAKPFDANTLVTQVSALITRKVLLLTDDNYVIDQVEKAFEKLDYKVDTVRTEDDLLKQGRGVKYTVLVIHLAYMDREPGVFLSWLRGRLRYKNPLLIIYCDAHVKTTESNDTLAIDELRRKWAKVGISTFYDARVTMGLFSDVLKGWGLHP